LTTVQRPTVPPSGQAVSVRGLVKEYRDGTRANRGIDLEVRRGEVVAVLGPNGAGKTTFLRQLTTELRPSGGEISVFGIDVVREPQRAKRLMGITPQEAGTFDTLSVRQHLQLFARLKGLSRRQSAEATTEIGELLGLTDHWSRPVGSLSGGQRRRILIGLALIGRPPLLVLDEPTTGLDPASRKAVWNVLRQTVTDGTTLVFSTHYMEEAERLSDRIAIIDTGRVIAFGTVRELVSRLHDSYRLSFHDPTYSNGHGHVRVQRYATFADVQLQIKRLRLSEYSIARASLEDVYFELAGHQFQDEDEEEPAEVLQ
jgi:ABC-type multidrug transport system ATPase subunit